MASATVTVSLGVASFASASAHKNATCVVSVGAFYTASPYGAAGFARAAASAKANFPGARVPIGYVNGDIKQPIYLNPTWERFLRYQYTDRLGGDTGPSMAEVQTNVVETKTQAINASTVAASVGVQAAANAEALAATVEVAQAASLPGATSIPPVVRRPYNTTILE